METGYKFFLKKFGGCRDGTYYPNTPLRPYGRGIEPLARKTMIVEKTFSTIKAWAEDQGLAGTRTIQFKQSPTKTYQDSTDPIQYAKLTVGGRTFVLSCSHWISTNVNLKATKKRGNSQIVKEILEVGEIRNFEKNGERWAFMKKDNSISLGDAQSLDDDL